MPCCLQDTSWLDIYLSEIPHVVYQVDDWDKTEGAEHRTLVNKGNEAMAYLQFILDYWGRFPASMVFLHGHRCVRLQPSRLLHEIGRHVDQLFLLQQSFCKAHEVAWHMQGRLSGRIP